MIIKQSFYVPAVVTTMTVAGFIIGYKVAERRLIAQFELRLEKETQGMREFYTASTKKPYATPQEAAADLIVEEAERIITADKVAYHKIVSAEGYTRVENPQETVVDFGEQPEVVKNIFAKNERDPEIPYVMSQEEFMENERDWEQITLTYYQKDGVLTDHREDVIEDPEKTIGPDAIGSFGLQSSDPAVVHVCNEKLGLMFEIVRHEGSYTLEVLGIDTPPPDLPSGRTRSD